MPRKKRDWYPGATYHVMCRGIRRMAIFREEEDYEMFLLMVKKTMECLPFTLHSYCMMTNHIHLQITTMDSEIWKIMKRLLSSYARNFNNKYGPEHEMKVVSHTKAYQKLAERAISRKRPNRHMIRRGVITYDE